MKLASRGRNSFREVQAFRLFRLRKALHLYFQHDPWCRKQIAMVLGCQRSGTTLLHHVFRLDLDCITYDEQSVLSSRDQREDRFRLDPVDEVRARLEKDRAPLVVFKPLVESQRAAALLDALPGSKAIWSYRHYKDVALSNVQFFARPQNSLRDLEPIFRGDETDWRCQHLSEEARTVVRAHFTPELDPHAAAALFWWVRNRLYFDQELDRTPRVTPCRYETLVDDPAGTMRRLYAFLERPYPGDRTVRDVFASSRGRGRDLDLPAPIRELCEDLHQRLETAHAAVTVADR